MTRITCLGEVLADLLPIEEAGETTGFRMHPGGSLLNVAVAAARLGSPVALAGRISTDFFGRYLRAYVEGEGVDTRWLLDTAAPSTLAFVAMETGDPVFTFYGEGAADTLVAPEDLTEALFSETGILHAGSISLLRGITPTAVVAACERLAGSALISLDPNLRPALVADEPAYRALLDRLLGLADVVKVSAADLAWLVPGERPEDAARRLLAAGPALVVVTRGSEHAIALRGDPASPELLAVDSFPVAVVDTVGAGDAFTAGLLTWLAERDVTSRPRLAGLATRDLTSALRFASAVAALNCARAGADPPARPEVEALLRATPPGGSAGAEGETNDGH